MKHKALIATAAVAALALTGCSSAADTTSENLSKAADNGSLTRTC